MHRWTLINFMDVACFHQQMACIGGRQLKVIMMEDDFDYFIRRANEERQRADKSSDSGVAKIHQELAEHYEAALGSLRNITATSSAGS